MFQIDLYKLLTLMQNKSSSLGTAYRILHVHLILISFFQAAKESEDKERDLKKRKKKTKER